MYVWTAGDYSINPFFLSLILKDFQLPLACFIYDQVLAIRNVIFNKMKCMCLMERSINHAESNQYTFISFCHIVTLYFYRLITICKKYVNIFSKKYSLLMHCESKYRRVCSVPSSVQRAGQSNAHLPLLSFLVFLLSCMSWIQNLLMWSSLKDTFSTSVPQWSDSNFP